MTPGDGGSDEPAPPLPADPPAPERNPAVDRAVAQHGVSMATHPDVPPPEPVQPLNTPPNPGQVQPAPEPI